MFSYDAMVEALSVYSQYVIEGAAHVKIDRVSRLCRPRPYVIYSKSLISHLARWFSTTRVL